MHTGVESPSFLAARRVTLRVETFQSEVSDDAPADVAVERLVERGPDMFRMEDRGARDRELEDRVQQAEQSGLSADGACRLRDTLSRRVDAFRRALRGDPPARGAHEGSPEATGAGRESWTSPVRSCEDRVVSVVHRGLGLSLIHI